MTVPGGFPGDADAVGPGPHCETCSGDVSLTHKPAAAPLPRQALRGLTRSPLSPPPPVHHCAPLRPGPRS